jgi:hypothetical protein
MKVSASIACFVLLTVNSYGQYYLNDIISTQQGAEQYKLLRNNKIRAVKVASYDGNNVLMEGFFLEQEISMDGKKITITDANISGRKNVTINTYELGKLKKAQANGNGIDNRTDYQYDDKGRLQKTILTTADTAMRYTTVETHEWSYDDQGQPLQMLKIKNRADTITVRFVKDEQGNIAEEHWKRKNVSLETYYYYYTNKHQLTDIVRYNNRVKKMLPDYLYEYDANGRISQMTQVALGNNNSYYTWKYTYNEKGLKQTETCYDKSKKKVASISYTYLATGGL